MPRAMQHAADGVAAADGLAFRLFDTVHTRTVDAHRLLHLALETGGRRSSASSRRRCSRRTSSAASDVGDHDVLRRGRRRRRASTRRGSTRCWRATSTPTRCRRHRPGPRVRRHRRAVLRRRPEVRRLRRPAGRGVQPAARPGLGGPSTRSLADGRRRRRRLRPGRLRHLSRLVSSSPRLGKPKPVGVQYRGCARELPDRPARGPRGGAGRQHPRRLPRQDRPAPPAARGSGSASAVAVRSALAFGVRALLRPARPHLRGPGADRRHPVDRRGRLRDLDDLLDGAGRPHA